MKIIACVRQTPDTETVVKIGADGKSISRNIIYLWPTKEVHLVPAHLQVETSGADGNFKVTVSSPVLARDVYLSFGNLDATLSDNYFNLLPGETRSITVTSKASLDALKAQMKVISLTDAFAPGNSQTAAVTVGN